MGYKKIKAKECLSWESSDCTKEEWEFLCKIFEEDPQVTYVLRISEFIVESYAGFEIVNDFCTPEDSVFSLS